MDQLLHRIAKRTHQHRRRHDDQHDANDDQQGGRQSLLAPDLAGQGLVERIERDGQNQRPDHQVQERGEDLVAQHGHGEDQAGTDQDIQQRGRQPLFEFLIRLAEGVFMGHLQEFRWHILVLSQISDGNEHNRHFL